MTMLTPEQKAGGEIDELLRAAGWSVQPRDRANLSASHGVAVAEFPLDTGFADYVLFVDKRPIGVIEAMPAESTLSGVETFFTNERDPQPRPPAPHAAAEHRGVLTGTGRGHSWRATISRTGTGGRRRGRRRTGRAVKAYEYSDEFDVCLSCRMNSTTHATDLLKTGSKGSISPQYVLNISALLDLGFNRGRSGWATS
jgi:hypothetical protein